MAKKKQVKPGAACASNVQLVRDVPPLSSGMQLWEYTGEAYLPEGAKRLYADKLKSAIRQFNILLDDFSYDDDGPSFASADDYYY